jgi:hypothetical protein
MRTKKDKTEETKILLSLPTELKEELRLEGEKEYRSLNNYILTLLLNRNKKELD